MVPGFRENVKSGLSRFHRHGKDILHEQPEHMWPGFFYSREQLTDRWWRDWISMREPRKTQKDAKAGLTHQKTWDLPQSRRGRKESAEEIFRELGYGDLPPVSGAHGHCFWTSLRFLGGLGGLANELTDQDLTVSLPP
jgi:hypothetical protein